MGNVYTTKRAKSAIPGIIRFSFWPNTRNGIAHEDSFKKVRTHCVAAGPPEDILQKWNYALSYAFYIKNSNIAFGDDYRHGKTDLNCRAAIIATLQTIGVPYSRDQYAQDAGTSCTVMPTSRAFNKASDGSETLERLWQLNRSFSHLLAAAWISEDGNTDPIPYALLSMNAEGTADCSTAPK